MEKKTYRQKVKFKRQFVIKAETPEEATDILQSLVDEVEFGGDVECEGFFEFEEDHADES